MAGLLGRALAALPQAIRDGAQAAGRKIALRADAGYFAGDLARAAAAENMVFTIGAKRITSMWRALATVGEDAWRDAIDMENAQVAVSPYKPADWPKGTVLLIRRVRLDPDQVFADPGRGAAALFTPISGPCCSRNWSRSSTECCASWGSSATRHPDGRARSALQASSPRSLDRQTAR